MRKERDEIMDQYAERINTVLSSHLNNVPVTGPGKAMQLLVVDDDPDIVDVVSMCFETHWPGTTVLHAPNGETAIESARSDEPDLIILDLGLPDIGGFEVCYRIRGFSEIPIVMLTVRDSREDIVKGLAIGADDYIVKPFSYQDLLARANAVLRRNRLAHLQHQEMVLQCGDLMIDFRHGEVYANSELINLSSADYKLLTDLVANAGRVVASKVLLNHNVGQEDQNEPTFMAARYKSPNLKSKQKSTAPGHYSTALNVTPALIT